MNVEYLVTRQYKKTFITGTKNELVEYLCAFLNMFIEDLKELVRELKRRLHTFVSMKETSKGQYKLEINGKFENLAKVHYS